MGCDGGTIPRRDELVRTKKKPEQKDKNAETVAKWKHCAISQDPLHKPIVSCELGKLYNKEAVLEHLLNKEKISSSEVASHIQKLSDVKELNLTEKSDFQAKSDHKGDEYVDLHDSRFICPVTALEMNGKQRFYFLWRCGCVLSERAIKEVKSETCHKCGTHFEQNDVIVINGSDEEISDLKERMAERRRIAKLEKRKKKAAAAEGCATKKIKVEIIPFINDSESISALEAKSKNVHLNGAKIKVEAGPSGYKKESKLQNGNSSSKVVELPEKAQKTYSIAKDPKASDAFKSLFTSHKSAQNQGKAHWVTHNPLYY